MRVFLDTNVLLAAYLGRGLCKDLHELVLTAHDFITSEVVLAELAANTHKFRTKPLTKALVQQMKAHAVEIAGAGSQVLPELANNPKDLRVIQGALTGRADVFVTGDKALQQIGVIGTMAILSPRRFWESLMQT